MTEFEIIKNYFATQTQRRSDVIVGIGDDAAVVKTPPGHELAITTDTLVEGIHFYASAKPEDIGYKSIAVNLSDLAAMGATPAWVTLAITLPNVDAKWLQRFCDGFFILANHHHVQLIGGDITHGPLSITIQAMGFVPTKKALLRSQAQPSDLIYVTGTLGDAGLALQFLQEKKPVASNHADYLLSRLHRPEPRIAIGQALLETAHAAIDISDGLAADLGHVLEQSHVGASVYVDQLPLSAELKHSLGWQEAITLALTAGDDYELCFTIPAAKRDELEKKLSAIPCCYTCIGVINEQQGMDLRYQDGKKYHGTILGYQHF